MSCTAIAKCTWSISRLSVACGTRNACPKSAASCTSGKSSAGSVSSVKRLLPACSVSLDWAARNRHRLVGGQRAQDVDQLPRADRDGERALVAVEVDAGADLDSRSLVVNSRRLPSFLSITLARIGSVCRRSTIPDTACNAESNFSCAAFNTSMLIFQKGGSSSRGRTNLWTTRFSSFATGSCVSRQTMCIAFV